MPETVIDARTGGSLSAATVELIDMELGKIISTERMRQIMRRAEGGVMANVSHATESTVTALLDARLAHMAVRGPLDGCEHCTFDAITRAA